MPWAARTSLGYEVLAKVVYTTMNEAVEALQFLGDCWQW